MSLAKLAGQVNGITQGSNLSNMISTKLFGDSRFLRNEEQKSGNRPIAGVVGAISSIQNIVSDISSALGAHDDMHVIGRYEDTEEKGFLGRLVEPVTTAFSRAVSYWTGNANSQNGVIIDGYDNFRGDLSVALPDNPVMYGTSVTDQVVRNPNRVSMRVYVDLVHTDDMIQNILQSVANSFGGLPGMLMGALTSNSMNRAQKALNGLQWIQENGRPFKVYTPHKVYDNMMIEKITPINDQKMNEILCADITFKEIIPTQSLGTKNKTTARIAPRTDVMDRASVAGWL